MEIRYLDLTALIVAIVSVLMVGCAIDSGTDLVIIEEPQKSSAESVPIEAPSEIVVEEPETSIESEPQSEPEEVIEAPLKKKVSVIDLLAKKPIEKTEWLTGVVVEVISSRPGYTVGKIREDDVFRKYKFTTDQLLQRWMEVNFKINQYDEVLEIITLDANNDGIPDIQVREYGTSLKGWEDGFRIMEGTVANIRHDRNGKTYGIIKVRDGSFKTYGFDTYDFFKNGDQVRFKLDEANTVSGIEVI